MLTVVLSLALLGAPEADPAGVEFFEKEIRPLLAEKCYACHSADAKRVKGGLYLDSRAGWMHGGDSGPAIVPGDPSKSLLIEAVRYDNSDLAMPPKSKLARREIDALEAWVKMGAPDPRTKANDPAAAGGEDKRQVGLTLEEGRKFWSYRPRVVPEVPVVKNGDWPRSSIDRFLLARMEKSGVKPVGDADRETLARRVYFDLIGLPPSPEELRNFVDDARPDALERLVDELLDSPRYGERWGRHWLDVARFAESVVLRGMLLKHAWRYRDYVIEAFNRDMPFDQFIREQLAGDLIEGGELSDRKRRRIATTYLTMGDHTLESQDKTQLDMDVVDEQLDVITKSFLAQTVTCARCHDHKFDPIPTRDYYALAGILKGVDTLKHSNVSGWVEMPLPLSAEEERVYSGHDAQLASLQAKLESLKQDSSAKTEKSKNKKTSPIVATSAYPGLVIDESEARAVGAWTHSTWTKRYIGEGYLHDAGELKGEKSLTFTPDLPAAGEYEVRFAYTPGPNRSRNVPVTISSASGIKTILIDEKAEPPIEERWVRLGKFRFESGTKGFVRVDTFDSSDVVTVDAVQFVTAEQLEESARRTRVKPETPVDAKREQKRREELQDGIKQLEADIKVLKAKAPRRPMVLTIKETKPVDVAVHVRGSVHSLGDVVPRGVLQVTFPTDSAYSAVAMPEKQSGRLEMADWIASSDNPLTARVFVNRAWHWLFGRGIVSTPDNFGTTGQRPTHPELLDWLAHRFVEERWSVKWLVREIVLSRAYQMSSLAAGDSNFAKIDPENLLLWHRPKRQLEAECIRDAMLSVSGKLRLDMGGRSYPASVKADYGYRHAAPQRSVYVPVFRNALPEIFEVFNGAHASMVTGKRDVSTVAPQALFLLNHPFVLEQTAATAAVLTKERDVSTGIRRAFALVLSRAPSDREFRIAAKNLGATPQAEEWARLVHALFNSLDFRYLH